MERKRRKCQENEWSLCAKWNDASKLCVCFLALFPKKKLIISILCFECFGPYTQNLRIFSMVLQNEKKIQFLFMFSAAEERKKIQFDSYWQAESCWQNGSGHSNSISWFWSFVNSQKIVEWCFNWRKKKFKIQLGIMSWDSKTLKERFVVVVLVEKNTIICLLHLSSTIRI